MWINTGQQRPPFAIEPKAGQESVWDYPRPPVLVPEPREVVVRFGDVEIARSVRALRVLETASPPTVYLPPEDVRGEFIVAAAGSSFCEWKGRAAYGSVRLADGREAASALWRYPAPTPAFAGIAGWWSFYPSRVECFLGDERVRPQGGGFYGGWVTYEIVGPWKGEAGTGGW
jgi:uncharacterized protein (DUF427 family)